MPEISIIIPVYNTRPFLEDCIDSILCQDFNDFELILVDDGSTDGSSLICDRKALDDPRVTCLHQPNQGQQEAVRSGLRKATGNWICFVDSDDRLTGDSLSTLRGFANDDTDIVVGFSFPGNGDVETIPIESWREKMLRGSAILCTRWGKLYHKSLFDDEATTVSRDIRVGEDMIMNISLAFRSDKPVTIVNRKVYCYNRNAGSVSSTYKWTAERYSVLFDTVRASIPHTVSNPEAMSRYRHAYIANAFSMLRDLITYQNPGKLRGLDSSPLYLTLKKEVTESGFRMDREERIMLRFPSCATTHCYFVTKRWLTIACQSLKRRLGL